jgi:hypothetical protein
MNLTEDMLQRRVLVDCVADVNAVSRMVGLFPMSQEQHDQESLDSSLRMAEIVELLPVLDRIANWVSEAATGIQIEGAEIPPDSEFATKFHAMVHSVVAMALFTSTANLVEMGCLELPSSS